MSLCIEAHNNFRAAVTSGCDICNFEPNERSALVPCACPSITSTSTISLLLSLCAFCYRRRFIGILFRLRPMRVYKCRSKATVSTLSFCVCLFFQLQSSNKKYMLYAPAQLYLLMLLDLERNVNLDHTWNSSYSRRSFVHSPPPR